MRTLFVLATLLLPALAGSARAADPQLVSQVEAMLGNDEKSILAALLTRPDLSAQFDQDAALALKDKKNLHPFLGVWRAKFGAFAESDLQRPNPDLNGHYGRYTDLMTGEMFAFLERSLSLMTEEKKNRVIGYLNSIDKDLQKNGRLSNGLLDFTRKMVTGILEEYRKHLSAYAASPIAKDAARDAASNTAAFSAIRKTDDETQAASKPAPKPDAKSEAAAATTAPAQDPKQTGPVSASDSGRAANSGVNGAREQLDRAAAAGVDGGRVMDGGGASRQTDAVVAPSGSGTARRPLPPSTPRSGSGLTASNPAVPPPSTLSKADSLLGMKTTHPNSSSSRKLKMGGGLLGALLGALIGFFVGGPVGAIVGGILGAAGGTAAGSRLAKRLAH